VNRLISHIFFRTLVKHFSVIIILTASLYIPTLDGKFVYDDHETIVKNPYIKDLKFVPAYFDPDNVKMWSFHREQRQFYRPIPLVTFALNYHVSGLNPFSYHLVNVVIHILTALAVYLSVYLTAQVLDRSKQGKPKETSLAFISSLLFAIHPLQTESVAYVVSRSVMICSLFLLCSFITFICAHKSNQKHKRLYQFSSIVCFVLSLCSKEIAIVFPLLIFTYHSLYYVVRKVPDRLHRIILSTLPYFVILVGYLVFRALFFSKDSLSSLITSHLVPYFATAVKAVFIYLRLLIVPIGQNVDHTLPIVGSVFEPWSILAFILLIISGWVLLTKVYPYSKFLFFWGLWFFIALSPNLLLPTKEAISEHTVYFPAIGFFAVCSYIALRIWAKFGRIFGDVERTVRIGIVLVIVTPLLFLTLNRNLVWQNEFSLWKDAVIKSPNKDRPHINLGLAYFNTGRFDEAISEFMTALSINPNNAKAMNNLGLVYATAGKLQEAEKSFAKSIQLEDINPDAYNNLGFLFVTKGLYEASIPILNEALRMNPDCSQVLSNIGIAYVNLGNKQRGCGYLKKAVNINPDSKRAHALYNLQCIKDHEM